MIKIGILFADDGGELAKRYMAMQKEMKVEIIPVYNVTQASLENDLEKLLEEKHAEVIICRNPLSFFVQKIATVPVIVLDIAVEDIVRAVMHYPHPIKKFAFFYYRSDMDKYKQIKGDLEQMTGCEVSLVPLEYNQSYDIDTVVYHYERELHTCDGIVTGTTMLGDFFQSHGKHAIYLSAEWYRIQEAIQDAISHAILYRRERYQLDMAQWALDSTGCYFIMTQGGKVSLINDRLCEMLDIPSRNLVGMKELKFWSVHPLLQKIKRTKGNEILHYKGIDYMVTFKSQHFSKYDDAISIYTMMSIRSIQSEEYKARRAMTQKGYVAKWRFKDIVRQNETMQRLVDKAEKYAASNANILITGESGTGKELLVQSIHNASEYRNGPFVAVNCSAIPENLLESELFGYVEGAFTGASKGGKVGMFELSQEGTLFLDEIGEMPLQMQAKLLRCIQENAVTRVGGTKVIPIKNRLICATNRNLLDEVYAGNFRGDLYYRIKVLSLAIPPLRERKEDLRELAQYFWEKYRKYDVQKLPDELIDKLYTYDWPGNIRELEAFVQRLNAIGWKYDMENEELHEILAELPVADEKEREKSSKEKNYKDHLILKKGTLDEMEDEILLRIYQECGGNLREAAQRLNIGYSTAQRRMKKLEQ